MGLYIVLRLYVSAIINPSCLLTASIILKLLNDSIFQMQIRVLY